jgi:hypothetical protein
VAHLDQRFRDQGHDLSVCWHWLQQRVADEGGSIDDIVRQEHQRQACAQVSTGNAITSMRLISALDWTAFFEEISLVERELRRDPAAVYARMDFATRDRYRHVIEGLARRSRLPELEVAQRVVVEAFHAPNDSARGHIGYYLVDDGRASFEARLGMNRTPIARLRQAFSRHPGWAFFGSLGTLWIAALAAVEVFAAWRGASLGTLILLAIVAWIPASEVAVALVNYLTSLRLSPRVLPKMEFKDGIPATDRTIVVIPSLLLSHDCLRGLLNSLPRESRSRAGFRLAHRLCRCAATRHAGRRGLADRCARRHSRAQRALRRRRQDPVLALSPGPPLESA